MDVAVKGRDVHAATITHIIHYGKPEIRYTL